MRIVLDMEEEVYNSLKEDVGICIYTCDIYEDITNPEYNLSEDYMGMDYSIPSEIKTLIKASVPCLLVETGTKDVSRVLDKKDFKRVFTLNLVDSPLIKDEYYFTNFSQKDVRYPDCKYHIKNVTSVKTKAINGTLFSYLIEDLVLFKQKDNYQ